jgi:peptide-methionine (S)-S-oxide reductase
MSEYTETAILAGGCFWPAQELLRHRDGVISTRTGYTGGKNDNPTADNHPGHAEDTIADADTSGLWPGKVVTKISQAGPFWEAEAEDQNYLQHYPHGKNQFSP